MITGQAHLIVITALLVDRPMCGDCLSAKSGLGQDDLDASLKILGAILKDRTAPDLCAACGITKQTVSLGRPSA